MIDDLLNNIAKLATEEANYERDKALLIAIHIYKIDTGFQATYKETQLLYEVISDRCDLENILRKKQKIELYKELKEEYKYRVK